MNFYSFSKTTGELLAVGLLDAANNPLVRDDLTTIAPPDRVPGYAPVWNGSAWSNVVDQRGQTYVDDAGKEITWSQLGTMPTGSITGLLVRAKAAKNEEIKAARAVAIDAPLSTPYGTFDSDKEGRDNVANAVQLVDKMVARGVASEIRFGLADNTRITLTAEEMGTVGLLLGQKVQAAYETASALRSQIEAATTVAEVEAIAWPT